MILKSEAEGGIDISTDAEILDLGCGTGIVGNLIKEKGYTNIFGLDASDNFIKMIHENKVYKGGEVLFLGQGVDKFPEKFKNKYDLVTGTGVFLPKHCPAETFDDAHAALKVGGHFIFTMRANLWVDGEEHGYKDKIN